MLGRAKARVRGTRVRFEMEGPRRVVTVEGRDLPEVERQRLRRLMRSLPIRSGTVAIHRDWNGRRRLSFSADIPEPLRQVIRNIFGNLSALRIP
jgi:hypothetical protein